MLMTSTVNQWLNGRIDQLRERHFDVSTSSSEYDPAGISINLFGRKRLGSALFWDSGAAEVEAIVADTEKLILNRSTIWTDAASINAILDELLDCLTSEESR